MITFSGIGVSKGISIGEAYLFNCKLQVPKYNISKFQIDSETDRFHNALRKVEQDYKKLRMNFEKNAGSEGAKLFDGSILLAKDETFINDVLNRLRNDKENIEWIIYDITDKIFKKLIILNDEIFRDRAVDFLNFGKRLVNTLLLDKSPNLAEVYKDVIIVSNDLAVSDTVNMNRQHILGIVTELGGATSHLAIVAKSLKIPTVLGVKDATSKIKESALIILDANNGKIFVDPDEATLDFYKKEKGKLNAKEKEEVSIKELPSITLDNRSIPLKANIEIPSQEMSLAIDAGVDGVGLYRSEFLCLSDKNKKIPAENDQFENYKLVLEKFSPKPVTIRTLDLGGDKILEGFTVRELNPNLGYRAIRLTLNNPKIMRDQLSALYRASVYGNLQIMFPMITGIGEFLQIENEINYVKNELRNKNIPFNNDVKIGVMIETPAAVMISDFLCKRCSFVSIGTNDLIQYTLAVDRNNEMVSYLYSPYHPAVLRMLKIIIDNAKIYNTKVSICGEMGGDPKGLLIFLGLGIDEISTGVNNIELDKKVIRNVNCNELKEFVNRLFALERAIQVEEELCNWISKNLPNIL